MTWFVLVKKTSLTIWTLFLLHLVHVYAEHSTLTPVKVALASETNTAWKSM